MGTRTGIGGDLGVCALGGGGGGRDEGGVGIEGNDNYSVIGVFVNTEIH